MTASMPTWMAAAAAVVVLGARPPPLPLRRLVLHLLPLGAPLLVTRKVDSGTILGSSIIALAHSLGRVVGLPEYVK